MIILLFPTTNKIFVCVAKSQNNTEEGSENNTGIEEISTLPMCLPGNTESHAIFIIYKYQGFWQASKSGLSSVF